ncbi:hypothetical protein MycrhDRAFT_4126 [Mycolicibacterium rhodesiae JS60]|nr:hypothetical protein MycrhDRAFT_4126 [Mycolicibacterium rhodesiae JS60]
MHNANLTLMPTSLEFEVLHQPGGDVCGFALRFNGTEQDLDAPDWHPQRLLGVDSVTIPVLSTDDLMELGAQLIAHADYFAGRPARDWSKLTSA